MIRQISRLLLSICIFALHLFPCTSAEEYTWRNVAIGGGGYVTGIEFHPAVRGLAYARTDVGGAYRRDSADGPWIALNDSLGGLDSEFMQLGVLSLALDPSDAGRVYLACGQYTAWWAPAGRFMSSSDRGATWTSIELPFRLGGNQAGRGTGERLAVDPLDGERLFLGTSQDGLWRSTDRGVTWKRLAGFPPAEAVFVRFDPSKAGTIYVSAAQSSAGSLWKSTDGGETWSVVPGQPEGLIALQSSFGPEGDLYVAFSDSIAPDDAKTGAVWKLDGSGSWSNLQVPGGQGGFAAVCADPKQPGRVIVSTLARWWPQDEIYQSDDGGKSWKPVLGGAKLDLRSAPWTTSLKPHWITDVEIDPFDSNRASFVTGYGIFSTSELGVSQGVPSWRFDNRGLEETVPLALVSPASGAPLVSAIMDFDGFRHDQLDVSPAGGRHAPHHGKSHSLDGAGRAPAVLARLHGASGSISRDGGRTWKDFPSAPPSMDDGQIAVSADGSRLLWCPKEGVPFFSTDDGARWTQASGCPSGKLWPAADRVERARFVVFDSATRRVFLSFDGGASFRPTMGELPEGGNRIESVPGQSSHLWHAAGKGGLWRSADGGGKFHRAAAVECAYHVGFGCPADWKSYPVAYLWGRVGGADGIFRSEDRGQTWQRINSERHQFGFINDITGDARVYGRVYLGTSGRGVIVGEPVGGRDGAEETGASGFQVR